MNIPQKTYDHFSRVSARYRELRTTDKEPIIFISESLKNLHAVKAADVGCGAGRYDLLLFQNLNKLHLTCIDINDSMLQEASNYLKSSGFSNFQTIKANANEIPLDKNSLDCVFTFNAIHHFDFVKFLEKSSEVIIEGGKIYIYTRLRSQNSRNIWGQHFPSFSEIETRLHELDEIENWIQSNGNLKLETIKRFKYKRTSTLEKLVEKAKGKHYSTFSLYENNALNESLKIFQENIKMRFPDVRQIEWYDENILFTLRSK